MRERLLERSPTSSRSSSRIAFFSTVTGAALDTAELDADYWYRNIRETVQFDQAVGPRAPTATAASSRAARTRRSSPRSRTPPASTSAPTPNRSSFRRSAATRAAWTGSSASAAQAWTSGVAVDWRALCGGGALVDAADVRLRPPAVLAGRRRLRGADAAGLGLTGAEHALLGAVVEVPDSGQVVLTGRLSTSSQPWLADHAVSRHNAVPRRGIRRVGDPRGRRGGLPGRRRADAAAPLAVPPSGVADPGASSTRPTSRVPVRCRCFHIPASDGSPWVLHAEATSAHATSARGRRLSAWPPTGAVAVDVSDAYDDDGRPAATSTARRFAG